MGGVCSEHAGDKKMLTNFWLASLKGREHSGDTGVIERIILIWTLVNKFWRRWIGFVRLRIGTGGRYL
jgi:hypothetical protein